MTREKSVGFMVYMVPSEIERLNAYLAETSPGRENRSDAVRRAVKEMIDRHEASKHKERKRS